MDQTTIFKRIYFDHLVYLFVCLSVIFYVPVRQSGINPVEYLYQVQELFFRYGVMFIFLASLFLKPLRKVDLRVIAFFVIYEILICSIFGFNNVSRRVILNLVIATLFYKVVAEHMTLKLRTFGFWVLGLLGVNAALMTLQAFNLDKLFTHVATIELGLKQINFNEKLIGFMKLKSNVGTLGAISGSVLMFIHPLASLVAIPFMIIGQTSATIAAFVISFLFVLFFRIKRWIWLGLVLLTLSSSAFYIIKYDFPLGQFTERFKVWHNSTFVILRSNPVIGAGPGSFALNRFATPQADGAAPINWQWAHNEYLQLFFENGITGIFFLWLFLKTQISDFIRFRDDRDIQVLFAAFICIALISFFHFPFHVGKFAGVCVFLMALYHGKVSELRCQE